MLKSKIFMILKDMFPVILENAKELYSRPLVHRLEKEQKEINKKIDEAWRTLRVTRGTIVFLFVWNLILTAALLYLYLREL